MAGPEFNKIEGEIWFDGVFLPWKEAKIHVLTHGLHYASSVFEGIRAYEGKLFKLEEHTQRLYDSALALGFTIPWSSEQIMTACQEILDRMNLTDAYVRPIAWRGSEMMGISAKKNTIHLAIAAWEWPHYFKPEERLKGLRLDIAHYRRPDPSTAPAHSKAAGLYMICTLSKHAAEEKGYADALMLDWRGQIAEATGANIFFTKQGQLHTPLPDCFLNGITRQTVIALAKKRAIPLVERAIFPEEMPSFDACFLTGTAVEVTPVSEIGPYHFTVDAITQTLMEDYEAFVHA